LSANVVNRRLSPRSGALGPQARPRAQRALGPQGRLRAQRALAPQARLRARERAPYVIDSRVVNFCLSEEQQLLRRSVREFAESEIKPRIREWDEHQHFPHELLPKLAELGLMGIQFPTDYGGAAMSAVDYCICIEELARVDPSISLSVAAHNGLGAAHIAMFGSEAQKAKYLTPLATGEKLAAWGLTEPSSGSDAAAMRTTAVRDGDHWVLNGSKAFITHGGSGHTMVVMAVTDKSKGNKGISAFIVERGTPGFIAGKKEDKLGMRASETTEVLFQNCRIPHSQLIGEEGHRDCRVVGWPRARRVRVGAQLRLRAETVWPCHRHLSVDSLEAGG
jgi:alkylation response protein AidB-like acyl-CoA dehydrogenase